MQTLPQAVVLDVGNVLLDWNPAYLYDKLIQDPEERNWFLTHVVTHGWHVEQDRGRSLADGIAVLSERFPGSSGLIAAFYDRWLETIAGPIEGSVAVMSALKSAGVPVHALTNFSAELWSVTLEAYPFLSGFDVAVVSGEVGFIKPDPRIFDVLVERTGLAASDMLFIDDREENVDAARQLGFRTIQFVGADALETELAALGLPVGAALPPARVPA